MAGAAGCPISPSGILPLSHPSRNLLRSNSWFASCKAMPSIGRSSPCSPPLFNYIRTQPNLLTVRNTTPKANTAKQNVKHFKKQPTLRYSRAAQRRPRSSRCFAHLFACDSTILSLPQKENVIRAQYMYSFLFSLHFLRAKRAESGALHGVTVPCERAPVHFQIQYALSPYENCYASTYLDLALFTFRFWTP